MKPAARWTLPLAAMVLLPGCDISTSPPEISITAVYRAQLQPINNSGVLGESAFAVNDARILAEVLAGRLVPGTHAVHVHTQEACPTADSDVNDDGVIDVLEAIAVSGEILIPLDDDLASQLPLEGFPVANATGTLEYAQVADFELFLSDLEAADPDPSDFVAKLPAGGQLRLETRSVLLFGISEDVELPETVATIGDAEPHEMVPVACGVLIRSV